MAESTIMGSLRFNTRMPGIDRVTVSSEFDFNWDGLWADLAAIERAALGETIHGRALSPKRRIATNQPVDEPSLPAYWRRASTFRSGSASATRPRTSPASLRTSRGMSFRFVEGTIYLPKCEAIPMSILSCSRFKITVFSGRPFGAGGRPRPASFAARAFTATSRPSTSWSPPRALTSKLPGTNWPRSKWRPRGKRSTESIRSTREGAAVTLDRRTFLTAGLGLAAAAANPGLLFPADNSLAHGCITDQSANELACWMATSHGARLAGRPRSLAAVRQGLCPAPA